MATASTDNGKSKTKGDIIPPHAMPSGSEMRVPMARIVADPAFNSRKFMPEDTIKEMASSLKREGQLAPVRVAPRSDGKYDLIYGFRRFAAAKVLEWDTILATVAEAGDLDMKTRMIQNFVENEARQDLTTFERAMRYQEMLALKTDKPILQSQLATMTHKSPGYVSRLLAGAEKLHPKLLERWKYDCGKEVETGGQHTSLITITTLRELIKFPHEDQLKWLDEQINGPAESDDDGDGDADGDAGPATDPRTSLRNIKAALIAAELAKKSAKKPDELAFAEGVVQALKFAIKPRKIDSILSIKDDKVCGPDGKPVSVPRPDAK